MDLLKDITQELRGDETEKRSHAGGRSAAASTGRDDDARRDGASERAATNEGPPADRSDDVHVCSFCETEFDASRRVCPECDAEVVLRGER